MASCQRLLKTLDGQIDIRYFLMHKASSEGYRDFFIFDGENYCQVDVRDSRSGADLKHAANG